MKISICDDAKCGRQRILDEIKLNKHFSDQVYLREFESGEKLLEHHKDDFKADIIFLDIQMDGMSGIDSANRIRLIDDEAIIVFVSSHPEEVFNTFECGVFYFVVKPYTHEQFQIVFDKAVRKYKAKNTYYTVKWKNHTSYLNIGDINYIERNERHVTFHTKYGDYKSKSSLSEVIKELELYGFVQTHQGYLVNMIKIRTIDKNDVIMNDGTRVMMSVRKRADIIKKFAEFIKR